MARLPRFVLPGQPQHVIQRGNNRIAIFRRPADYRYYLDRLEAAAGKYQCAIHAYVLMTNHVHLLLTPETPDGISKLMQAVGRYYVRFYNQRYRRTGTLWEGRYRATLIDSERYLLTCMRYIELNPVRAGMVSHPSEYRWSSYRHTALGHADALLTTHSVYRRLEGTDDGRQRAYRQLFRSGLADQTLTDIRDATNNAWVLGDSRFIHRIGRHVARRVEPTPRGGARRGFNGFNGVRLH